MDKNKAKILSQIQENIKSKKPIPLWIVSSVRVGVLGLCLIFLVFSIISVGIFIFDIFEKISIEQFFEQRIYNPSHYLFEYIILSLILVLTLVFFYRKFDWPMVKEKNKIFAVGMLFVIIFGFGTAELAEKVFFIRQGLRSVKEIYNNTIPIRNAQKTTVHKFLKASNNVVGRISSLKEEGEDMFIEIKINNTKETYNMKKTSVIEKLRVGEKVAIHFDTDQKTILKIKIIK